MNLDRGESKPLTFTGRQRLRLAVAAMAIAIGVSAAPELHAQAAYPERPVKIVVGFAPGGTNDILARYMAGKLQERLGQPFVVENRPGAASAVGTGFVAKSNPDGYTLLVSSSGGLTVNPVTMKNLAYDPEKDFEPIALLSTFPLVVTANARLPFSNYSGLVDYAKRSRKGELNHASITSSFQLVAEMLADHSNVKFTHINYRGSGPALAALLGGEIDFAVVDIAAAVGHLKAGTLKALAVTTPKRSSALPDVPTVAETGFKGFDATIWTGLLAPKGTPEPVLAKLRNTVNAILAEKDTVQKFTELGMEPGNTDGGALSRRISSDIRQWGAIAKKAGIEPQ